MTKIPSLRRLTTGFVFASLLVMGCKKDQSNSSESLAQEEEQAAVYMAESETESETTFDDVQNNVLGVNAELGFGGAGIFSRTAETNSVAKLDSMPSCVRVTISPLQPNSFPKTVVMDFGTGCRSHGHLRSGKITTVYTGRLIDAGKSATTTFDNFKIDSVAVEGTHRITNTTAAGANQRQFKIEVSNGKLTRPNGDYQERNATQVHTQIEGNATVSPADDIFRITGNSNGKVKRGPRVVSWKSEVLEPLLKKFTCRWISKGTIKTVREGLPTSTPWIGVLHFGDGTCDNKAVLVINGKEHQIVLR